MQFAADAAEAGSDGAGGDAEHGGDLGARQLLPHGQDEDVAVGGRERVEGVDERVDLAAGVDALLGPHERIERGSRPVARGPECSEPALLGAPVAVEDVGRDAEQPHPLRPG